MSTPKKAAFAQKAQPAKLSREELIARAENAIENMREEFNDWMDEETAGLSSVLELWLKTPTDPDLSNELFRRAHDFKGQAATLGYPIVGRIASSLCDLLSIAKVDDANRIALAVGHVNAITAAVREEVRDDTNAVAETLATELAAAVALFCDA